jgi:polyisoprenyl-teichoic acid--peptidoglycan teichoic acid transferase
MARFWRNLILLVLFALTSMASTAQDLPTYTPPASKAWDGKSRYTVLVLGMDRRPGARDTLSTRTDVMILVSFDPATRTIGMLHIPRDIHLALPDSGELVRVNTLLVLGEQKAIGYGPYYAMETLQANLGMYIDAYIAFDFEAFITLIDAMGGVVMDIPYEIYDATYPDMNFGYDPFYINAGVQTLDGRTALKYARTRHGDNDYVRGQRQMAVMTAVKDRLTDSLVLQSMLSQVPSLVTELDGNVYSNIAFDQLTFLGLVMLESKPSVVTGGINTSNSFEYNTPNGVVRIPDREKLAQLLVDTFGSDYWK